MSKGEGDGEREIGGSSIINPMAGRDALADQFAQFRDEETAHKDLAVEEGAKSAAGYPALSALISTGCLTAIALCTRI